MLEHEHAIDITHLPLSRLTLVGAVFELLALSLVYVSARPAATLRIEPAE